MTATEHDDEPTQLLDPLVVRSSQRVGRVLREKWRLDVLLGVGGMAAVYAATHRNGSRGAIKILHAELSINAEVRTRFLREGYAANAVGHDGVVRVSDDDIAEDGSAFLVMELLDGETLEERRLRYGGRLTEDEVLSVADQVLDVLVAAHAKGIVHRDLKPENVFLTRDGQVKVLDFGIAHLRERSTATRATRAGHAMGTPSFMAPEQARGAWDQVDGRSDLWSLGATLFSLLSGTEVHSGSTAYEVVFSAATNPAPSLASVLPNVSPTVALVVDKALAFERDQRWRDASTMQEAVRSAYHDRHGSPISTAPRLTVPPSVANRTLASATIAPNSPAAPTTNGAVAAPPLAMSGALAVISQTLRSPRPILIGLAVGAAVAVAAIAVRVALEPSGGKASASSAAEVTSVAPASPVPLVARAVSSSPGSSASSPATPKPSAAPVVAVTDLPTETAPPLEVAKAAPARAKPLATPTQASSTPSPKTGCEPPFTIDPVTGKKNFKLECL